MSIGNFIAGNRDAKKIAGAQTYAADQSTALQREQLEYLKQIQAPFLAAGQTALPYLQQFASQPAAQFSFDPSQYMQGAEYKGLQNQYEQSAFRNASATGGLRGGDTQAALASISPQLLQQARQNAQQEFSLNQGANLNQYNILQGLAGLGTGAASQVGNAAQVFGQNAGNNALRQGQAIADKYAAYGQNRQGLLTDLMTPFFRGGF